MDQSRYVPDSNAAAQSSPPSPKSDDQWIANRMNLLLSAYRRDDYADPMAFLAQLGVILSRYPRQVVERVTDPLTGLQRKLKFPPTIAEVVEACDAEVAHMDSVARLRGLGSPSMRSRRVAATPLAGQDYDTLTEGGKKRPIGPFEPGRQIPYRG